MRVELDVPRDRAIVYFSDEPQSLDHGATYLALVRNESDPEAGPATVQLGFEDYERLLFVVVEQASVVLPAELLSSATRLVPDPFDPSSPSRGDGARDLDA